MKKVTILFPDEHLPYSPSVLNLQKNLSKEFDTTIVGFSNRQFKKLQQPFIKYLDVPFIQKKIYGLINRFSKKYGREILAHIKKGLVQKNFNYFKVEHVIVTDLIGLWLVEKMPINKLHLLSLELTWNTFNFSKKVDFTRVTSIIIQSPERLKYLASGFKNKVFFIQNAPSEPSFKRVIETAKTDLIFTGTALEKFGFIACLKFLIQYPEYTLTLQGKLLDAEATIISEHFNQLKVENRLIIESTYLSESELIKKVSNYRIGFCLYDFNFNEINNINYFTAPSGKMFTCFAAGVPLVGINIPGLKPILDFNAGFLIDNLQPSSIKQAVDEIEINYSSMVQGCYNAAEHFNFENAVKPFVNFLITGE